MSVVPASVNISDSYREIRANTIKTAIHTSKRSGPTSLVNRIASKLVSTVMDRISIMTDSDIRPP